MIEEFSGIWSCAKCGATGEGRIVNHRCSENSQRTDPLTHALSEFPADGRIYTGAHVRSAILRAWEAGVKESAEIAMAVDSKRGNEAAIARFILGLLPKGAP